HRQRRHRRLQRTIIAGAGRAGPRVPRCAPGIERAHDPRHGLRRHASNRLERQRHRPPAESSRGDRRQPTALTSELAPYLVAAWFPLIVLAVFAVFQWRYRLAIVRTIYTVADRFDETETQSRTDRTEGPALVLDWRDAAAPTSLPILPALAIAKRERQG